MQRHFIAVARRHLRPIVGADEIEAARGIVEYVAARSIHVVDAHLLARMVHLITRLAVGIDLGVVHRYIIYVARHRIAARRRIITRREHERHAVIAQLLHVIGRAAQDGLRIVGGATAADRCQQSEQNNNRTFHKHAVNFMSQAARAPRPRDARRHTPSGERQNTPRSCNLASKEGRS